MFEDEAEMYSPRPSADEDDVDEGSNHKEDLLRRDSNDGVVPETTTIIKSEKMSSQVASMFDEEPEETPNLHGSKVKIMENNEIKHSTAAPTATPKIGKKSILKAAAEQLSLEESQMSTNALFEAAAGIAMDEGIDVPKNDNSELSKASAKLLERQQSASQDASELLVEMGIDPDKIAIPPSEDEKADEATDALLFAAGINPSAESDTNAMLLSMGIDPSSLPTIGQEAEDGDLAALAADMGVALKSDLDADTTALFEQMGLNINAIDSSADALINDINANTNLSSRDKARYLQSLERRNGGSQRFDRKYFNSSVIQEPSKISKLLRSSRNKEHLSKSFSNFTQERLFLTMRKAKPINGESSPKSLKLPEEKILENSLRLSKTGLKNPNIVTDSKVLKMLEITARGNRVANRVNYAKDDDKEHCRFHPKLVTKNINDGSNNDEDDVKSNFIERQEAFKRDQKLKLETAIGKQNYDAIIDKKICPKCGSKQSFDEVKEKRKKCPNCAVDYRPKLIWNNVRNRFLKRQDDYIKEFKEFEEFIKKTRDIESIELRNTIIRAVYNYKKHRLEMKKFETAFPVWTEDIEDDFFSRMEDKLETKQKHLDDLRTVIYDRNIYTFQPSTTSSLLMADSKNRSISKSSFSKSLQHYLHNNNNDDDLYDDDYDPVKEFEKRYYMDLWRREKRRDDIETYGEMRHRLSGYDDDNYDYNDDDNGSHKSFSMSGSIRGSSRGRRTDRLDDDYKATGHRSRTLRSSSFDWSTSSRIK